MINKRSVWLHDVNLIPPTLLFFILVLLLLKAFPLSNHFLFILYQAHQINQMDLWDGPPWHGRFE